MKRQVEVGQLYRSPGSSILWQVDYLTTRAGIPHARLVSVQTLHETRLVACSVLLDVVRYRLVQAAPAVPVAGVGSTLGA